MSSGPRWITEAEAAPYELIKRATAILTDDQIKALPTTAVELVTAQGDNTMIIPVSAIGILDTSAGAYTNTANASWSLTHPLAGVSTEVLAETALAGAAISMIQFPVMFLQYANADFQADFIPHVITEKLSGEVTNRINQPLMLLDYYDGVTNYTDGHPDNTLTVDVLYWVKTL